MLLVPTKHMFEAIGKNFIPPLTHTLTSFTISSSSSLSLLYLRAIDPHLRKIDIKPDKLFQAIHGASCSPVYDMTPWLNISAASGSLFPYSFFSFFSPPPFLPLKLSHQPQVSQSWGALWMLLWTWFCFHTAPSKMHHCAVLVRNNQESENQPELCPPYHLPQRKELIFLA